MSKQSKPSLGEYVKAHVAMPESYAKTADELTNRIVAMGPRIMSVSNPFDLFKIGLECDDIGPSLFQASWALAQAKRLISEAT